MSNASKWDTTVQRGVDQANEEVTRLTSLKASVDAEVAELQPHIANADVARVHTQLTQRSTFLGEQLTRANAIVTDRTARLYASLTTADKAFVDALATDTDVQVCAASTMAVSAIKTRCDATSGFGLGASCSSQVLQSIVGNP